MSYMRCFPFLPRMNGKTFLNRYCRRNPRQNSATFTGNHVSAGRVYPRKKGTWSPAYNR